MTRDEVEWRDCCSSHAVTSSVIYYSTHTRKKCNLFVLYNKNSKVYLKIFGARKKKKKSADVICVCPLIDHGQQPMKMHTEVTLLYKLIQ